MEHYHSGKLQAPGQLIVPISPVAPLSLITLSMQIGSVFRPDEGSAWLCFAAALWVGFAGSLRPRELADIQRRDVTLLSDVLPPFSHRL